MFIGCYFFKKTIQIEMKGIGMHITCSKGLVSLAFIFMVLSANSVISAPIEATFLTHPDLVNKSPFGTDPNDIYFQGTFDGVSDTAFTPGSSPGLNTIGAASWSNNFLFDGTFDGVLNGAPFGFSWALGSNTGIDGQVFFDVNGPVTAITRSFEAGGFEDGLQPAFDIDGVFPPAESVFDPNISENNTIVLFSNNTSTISGNYTTIEINSDPNGFFGSSTSLPIAAFYITNQQDPEVVFPIGSPVFNGLPANITRDGVVDHFKYVMTLAPANWTVLYLSIFSVHVVPDAGVILRDADGNPINDVNGVPVPFPETESLTVYTLYSTDPRAIPIVQPNTENVPLPHWFYGVLLVFLATIGGWLSFSRARS